MQTEAVAAGWCAYAAVLQIAQLMWLPDVHHWRSAAADDFELMLGGTLTAVKHRLWHQVQVCRSKQLAMHNRGLYLSDAFSGPGPWLPLPRHASHDNAITAHEQIHADQTQRDCSPSYTALHSS